MQLAGTDLRVLRVFDAVVRHGGFAAAQAELNVSQPTISNHITALEQRLGVSVCQRGRTGFRLTEKGEMVFAATQRLLQALDDFSEEVGSLKGQLAGDLKVGVVDCIATDPNCRLQEVISRFSARPNEVTLCLSQEFPQNLQEKVLKGDLHIGIGSFPHKIKGLDYTPLYEETHGLYCGRGHHLFDVEDRELDMEGLRNEPIVSRAYWRDEHRKSLGFNNVAAVVYQIEPQLISVMSGRYIGFLPEHYARAWVESGALRRLSSEAVLYVCVFDMILRSGYRQTQVVETFAGDLRSAYGK